MNEEEVRQLDRIIEKVRLLRLDMRQAIRESDERMRPVRRRWREAGLDIKDPEPPVWGPLD
jgi:hypothetical protein